MSHEPLLVAVKARTEDAALEAAWNFVGDRCYNPEMPDRKLPINLCDGYSFETVFPLDGDHTMTGDAVFHYAEASGILVLDGEIVRKWADSQAKAKAHDKFQSLRFKGYWIVVFDVHV